MLYDLFYPGGARKLWICAIVILVILSLNACDEQKPRVHRVGVLCGLDVFATTIDGFKAKMAELD